MIISVISYKGGTGKTTLAVNLAAALGFPLIDCDMQGTATAWKGAPVKEWPIEEKDVSGWVRRVRSVPDTVIIDGPPNLGHAVQAIILVSDLILIPCCPSGADIHSTSKFIGLARSIQKNGKPEIWIVPNRVDTRTAPGKQIVEALEGFKEVVTEPVKQRSAHVMAFSARQWIGEYAPGSEAHLEIETLAKRLKEWLNQK